MIVHMDDELFEKCGGSEENIVKLLKTFGKYNVIEKAILLSPEEVERIQKATDTIVSSGKDVVSIVERLSSMSIAGSRFQFSPGQLTRLKEQADFYEKPVKEYTSELVARKMTELLSGEI